MIAYFVCFPYGILDETMVFDGMLFVVD